MVDDLDKLLQSRYTPKAPSNLAHRTIEQAAGRHKQKPVSLWDEIMTLFVLPRPAYAVGFSLLFGLLLGFQAGGILDSTYMDWASFLVVDEGGWL